MSAESSDREAAEPPDLQPTRTWVRVIDRILWGQNAPKSKAQRARKWKSMGKDLLSVSRWISWMTR